MFVVVGGVVVFAIGLPMHARKCVYFANVQKREREKERKTVYGSERDFPLKHYMLLEKLA